MLLVSGMCFINVDGALGQSFMDGANPCTVPPSSGTTCSFAQGDGASASNGATAIGGAIATGGGSVGIGAGNASGSVSVAIGGTASGSHSYTLGVGAAAGDHAISVGAENVANADYSYAFGEYLKTDASASHNFVIGGGIFGSTQFTNNISNSIMLGVNSNVSTIFIEDAGGYSGGIGRVGIGTTEPDGLVHMKDESGDDTYMFIEKGTGDNGGIIWHNGAQSETTINAAVVLDDAEDLIIENRITDEDIIFNVSDGGTDTEVMRIDASTSRVGIGTLAPNAKLEVNAEAETGGESIGWFTVSDATEDRLRIRNGTSNAGEFTPVILGQVSSHNNEALRFTASTDNDAGTNPIMVFQSRLQNPLAAVATRPLFRWSDYTSTVMQMDANGNLGIGTTSPSGKLEVNGTVFVDFSSLPGGSTTTDYFIGTDATGQILNLGMSSIEFKEAVEDIEFDKEAFLNLRPVDFRWKEFHGGKMDVGLIAQEVEQTFPALASYAYKRTHLPNGDFERDSLGMAIEDTTQMEVGGVRYHKLPVYLLSVAKGQQQEIEELRTQIETLSTIVQNCCVAGPAYRLEQGSDVNKDDVTRKELDEYVLLRNDPNPFADYTDISYETSSCNNCQIIVTDMNGRVVKRIDLRNSNGKIRVYSSEIGTGVFSYNIIEEGRVIGSSKMISSRQR
ncbi:MAG: tail fiber domain-containing protein [Flavobacteriales bacterium]